MPRRSLTAAVLTIALSIASQTASQPPTSQPPSSQPPPSPWKAKNLEFFPKDITREALTQKMREFSLGLGVRCQYCHVGGDGVSFEGVVFDSDEKPAKRVARAMLRMTDQLNAVALAQLPSRAEPRVSVECATCHRGVAIPRSLQTILFEIIQTQGTAAAVAKYRELRADAMLGRYNFGEWEINELARRLTQAGKPREAIAMFEMNSEFYPAAAEIDVFIGEEYQKLGDREQARQHYRAALAKSPESDFAKKHLAELEKIEQSPEGRTPPE